MLLYPMSNIIVRVQRNCFMYSSNIFYCITCITLSNVAVWTSSFQYIHTDLHMYLNTCERTMKRTIKEVKQA